MIDSISETRSIEMSLLGILRPVVGSGLPSFESLKFIDRCEVSGRYTSEELEILKASLYRYEMLIPFETYENAVKVFPWDPPAEVHEHLKNLVPYIRGITKAELDCALNEMANDESHPDWLAANMLRDQINEHRIKESNQQVAKVAREATAAEQTQTTGRDNFLTRRPAASSITPRNRIYCISNEGTTLPRPSASNNQRYLINFFQDP